MTNLDDPDFQKFLEEHGRTISPHEMCEDSYFVNRLIDDIFGTAARKFNKSKSKSTNQVTSLDLLWRDYQKERGDSDATDDL